MSLTLRNNVKPVLMKEWQHNGRCESNNSRMKMVRLKTQQLHVSIRVTDTNQMT